MKRLPLISIVLLVIVLAGLPQLIKKDSTINLLILIFLYITLATGWNILGGYTGQTSLGHAAYFGLGALATRLLWFKGFPILPSIVAGNLEARAETKAGKVLPMSMQGRIVIDPAQQSFALADVDASGQPVSAVQVSPDKRRFYLFEGDVLRIEVRDAAGDRPHLRGRLSF